MHKTPGKKSFIVTKCKRLFLIISRISLTFAFDIRAELYLEVYKFDFLPRRILALHWVRAKGVFTLFI